jgi:arginyl-tRNA synthetase
MIDEFCLLQYFTGSQASHIYNMAAASSALVDKLKSLDVSEPLPKYPNCFPEVNTVDIYRAHLSSILSEVTGVDAKIIYPALQWTQTLEKGDLVLPVPALRVKGKKPNELAAEWVEKVVTFGFGGIELPLIDLLVS